MSSIKDFLVGLGFDIDEQGLNNFKSGIAKATVAATALGAAATVASGFISHFVASTAEYFDQIAHIDERVNATASSTLAWSYAASLTGSSAEALTRSLEGLNRAAGESAIGIGRGAEAFKKLGINAKDNNGKLKTSTQLLDEIGQKIKGLEATKQTAILQKLGIDPSLVKTLTTDISGLKKEFNAIYEGVGIDADKAADSSVEFVDSLTRMKFVFKALHDAIALKFMPQIMEGMDTFRKFMVDNAPKIIGSIAPIVGLILKISSVFITLAGRVFQLAGKIIDFFLKINKATGGWAGYILAAVAAWKFLNLAFLASPLGIILSLIVAVGLLIDDFLTFKEGGKSLINWNSKLGKTLFGLVSVIGTLGAAMIAAKGFAIAWAASQAALSAVLGVARVAMLGLNLVMYANPIGLVIAAIVALIAVGVLLIKNWGKVKEWFSEFFEWFSKKFGKMAEIAGKVVGAVKGVFGGGDKGDNVKLTPSPAAAAALNSNKNISQDTKIIIQGGSSPDSTARAVSNEQSKVNADMVRNLSGATQ